MIQIITGDDEEQIKKYLKEVRAKDIENIFVFKDEHASKLIKQAEELVRKYGNTNYYYYVLTYNPTVIHAIDAYIYKYKRSPLEVKFFTKDGWEIITSKPNSEKMNEVYNNLITPTDILYYGV